MSEILVTFDLRTPGKTDGELFVDMIKELRTQHHDETQHLRATTYDMAVKGKQCERLGQLGLIPVGKVPRLGGRVAERNLGEHNFKLAAAGTPKHPQFVRLVVLAMDGPPVIEDVNGHGEICYVPLVRQRVQLRPRSDGCSIYVEWAIPDTHPDKSLHGAVTSIRHTLTSDELEEDPNRLAAALRIIPESDEDHDDLFGLREDPESSNAHLKRILRGRARSADSRKMRVCLIAYQVLLLVRALDAPSPGQFLNRHIGLLRGRHTKATGLAPETRRALQQPQRRLEPNAVHNSLVAGPSTLIGPRCAPRCHREPTGTLKRATTTSQNQ